MTTQKKMTFRHFQHQIQQSFKKLFDRLNRLMFLERFFLLILMSIFIFLFFYFLLIAPSLQTVEQLKMKIQMNEQQIQQAQRKTEQLVQQMQSELSTLQGEYQSLFSEFNRLGEEVDRLGKRFVMASTVISAFKKALNGYQPLRLQSVTTAPIQLLIDVQGGQQQVKTQELSFVFQGSYFNVQDYLATIEGLEMQIFWDQLTFEVIKYPQASVKLKVLLLYPPKEFWMFHD